MIVSASRDGMVKFWSLDGKELKNIKGNDLVYDVKFSPDGKKFAMANQDRTISLWNFDLDDLVMRGCVWIHDYLQNNEKNEKFSKKNHNFCNDIISSSSLLIEQGINLSKLGNIDEATSKFQEAIELDSK